MTREEIIAAVRLLINDPVVSGNNGAYATEAEMIADLDQVCIDFLDQSRVMRTYSVIDFGDGDRVLDLPEDCNEIIRVIRSDGFELKLSSSRELSYAYPMWLSTEGQPRNWYTDLTGDDQFSIWPTPTEDDSVTVYYYQGHVPGEDIVIPARFHQTLIWGLAAKALFKSNSDIDQVKLQKFSGAYTAGLADAAKAARANFTRGARNFSTEPF